MLRKWYTELALLLSAIILSVYFAFKIDFASSEHLMFGEPKAPQPIDRVTEKPHTSALSEKAKNQWREGKNLFKSNCASCHNPKADGTGPALMGVTARWQAAGKYKNKTPEQWLKVWIKNWHQAVEAGYPYAVAMANSRPSEMNVFITLTDEQIDDILAYVEEPAVYAAPVAQNVKGPE